MRPTLRRGRIPALFAGLLPLAAVLPLGAALPLAAGCRGQVSEKPPIHPIGDMDWQPRYDPQEKSEFFKDGRASRLPVEGTVARGQLRADPAFYEGREGAAFVARAPVAEAARRLRLPAEGMSAAFLARGQERYDIYCATCHDRTGAGNGMVIQRSPPGAPRPTFLPQRAAELRDGELFDVISHGKRALEPGKPHRMPGYASQLPPEDRWAIVAWVRVLERSQYTRLAELSQRDREEILAEVKAR